MIPYCHPLVTVLRSNICKVRYVRQSRSWWGGRLFLYVRSLLASMKGCGFWRELAKGAEARVGNDFVKLGPNIEVVHAK